VVLRSRQWSLSVRTFTRTMPRTPRLPAPGQRLNHRRPPRLAAGDPGRSPRRGSPPQRLRHVHGANDVTKASDRLFTFCPVCADAGVPEMHRSARLISTWQNQPLALVTTGWARNGPTEAVSLLIKRIKCVGFGFRDLANYRLRLLVHCGTT